MSSGRRRFSYVDDVRTFMTAVVRGSGIVALGVLFVVSYSPFDNLLASCFRSYLCGLSANACFMLHQRLYMTASHL